MRRKLITLALLGVALFAGGWTLRPVAVSWEYKESCSPKDMNNFGAEGWELVAVARVGVGTCLFFKRPK